MQDDAGRHPIGQDGTATNSTSACDAAVVAEAKQNEPATSPIAATKGDKQQALPSEGSGGEGSDAVAIDPALMKRHLSRTRGVVAGLVLTYILLAFVDTGVASCSLTTVQERMNTTLTAVTVAATMAEAAKLTGLPLVSQVTAAGEFQGRVVGAGTVVAAVGYFVVGTSTTVYQVGVGYFIQGLGFTCMSALHTPMIDFFVIREKTRMSWYLGLCYFGAAFGAALGFVTCGATVELSEDSWRWSFYGPGCAGVFFAAAMVIFDRYALISRQAVHDAEVELARAHPNHPHVHHLYNHNEASAHHRLPCGVFVRVVKRLSTNRPFVFAVAAGVFILFYLTAYISLVPSFVERGLGESKQTASFVLAAAIPAIMAATVIGGGIVRCLDLTLRGVLRLCTFCCLGAIPASFIFFSRSLALFIPLLIIAMIISYLLASPQVTVYTLSVRFGLAKEDALLHDDGDEELVEGGAEAAPNDDQGDADDDGPAASATVPAEPPASAEPDMARRPDILIVNANIGAAIFARAFGSIPGPIVLAALVDSDAFGSMALAFVAVGLFGTVFAALFMLLSTASGPEEGDPLLDDDSMAAGL